MRPDHFMLLGLLMSGCTDYELEDQRPQQVPQPELSLSELHVDFGALSDGDELSTLLWLENTGTAALSILNVTLSGSAAFSVTMPEKIDTLQPGESDSLVLHYSPINLDEEATLAILTNDPDRPESLVSLYGTGSFPELVLSENPLILSTISPGSDTANTVTLTNAGEAELWVDSLIVTGSAFSLAEDIDLPFSLSPDESRSVEIAFASDVPGTFDGQIWIEDNTVSGLSSGGLLGASAVPVALCSASSATIAPIHGSTDWLGDASFDAGGGQLAEYQWSLISRPAGSAVTMNGTDSANRYNFTPDLAGEYTAQLIVVNSEGIASEPCTTTIEAIPDQNLWIEMFWTHPEDDMDLHLLQPGGELGADSDCFYDNCINGGLDWGELGVSTDDPSLDIDDIHGTGPENINIPVPESGTFTVIVHDYQFSTPNYLDANDVTVNVYLGGRLAWTGSKPISIEDSYTRFVKITWPEGTITEL